MSRRKKRSAFDQVSEFDRGRIVAYRDCGLCFRENGSSVGRNQTTVMQICAHWMQEGMTDRRGRSLSPQCTTSREDRQIVHMAVTDDSVTSRTVVQHIESVTHHSVSARTIRCRLQQSGLSARRALLGLPLTQNHRRLRRQSGDERRMCVEEWNEVVFTDESRICLQHHDGRIRVWRHRGELRYEPPHSSSTGYYGMGRYSISLSHSSSTHCWNFKQPTLHLRGVGASCPVSITDRKYVVHGCSTIDPDYNPSCHTRSTLAPCGSCLVCCTPETHGSLFESMPWRVAAVISNNGGYCG
ncbi:transposable element Tcb1 transposase [Trichonephila clavipes]|nr:transposable element Tcb1 transposase [Trichonephila clavipes]